MATNFPTSVDNFTNPTANDSLNAPSHSLQHANTNDAIEAVEDYLLNGAGKTGLVHLNTTNFTSQNIVLIQSVFNANYENYLIELNVTGGTTGGIYFNLLNGTTLAPSNYNFAQWAYSTTASTVDSFGANDSANVQVTNIHSSFPNLTDVQVFVKSPFLTRSSHIKANGFYFNGTRQGLAITDCCHYTSASYDSFRFWIGSSGTMTGTIRVYGLRNS